MARRYDSLTPIVSPQEKDEETVEHNKSSKKRTSWFQKDSSSVPNETTRSRSKSSLKFWKKKEAKKEVKKEESKPANGSNLKKVEETSDSSLDSNEIFPLEEEYQGETMFKGEGSLNLIIDKSLYIPLGTGCVRIIKEKTGSYKIHILSEEKINEAEEKTYLITEKCKPKKKSNLSTQLKLKPRKGKLVAVFEDEKVNNLFNETLLKIFQINQASDVKKITEDMENVDLSYTTKDDSSQTHNENDMKSVHFNDEIKIINLPPGDKQEKKMQTLPPTRSD